MKTETNGMMVNLSNRKGFSLVEMAVVLVIIGLIIGAVMKGQDLITNARAKQVTTAVNTWKALAFAYMDRNGRLPGDYGRDGLIGDQGILSTPALAFSEYSSTGTGNASVGSAIKELKATMTNAPSNPIVVGSVKFYTYFGNVPGKPSGSVSSRRNVMIICKDENCTDTFTADELEIIKAVDTAIDGSANAAQGSFRANTGALDTIVPVKTEWVANLSTFSNFSTLSTLDTPWATTDKMAVWAFDRTF